MTNEEFYITCANLLDVEYNCSPFPWKKRTRWNNRVPGSGRYEGCGIIRIFGDKVHVSLRSPVILTKIFDSKQEVLDFLKESFPMGEQANAAVC